MILSEQELKDTNMKTAQYYIGLILIPVLFLMYFVQAMTSAVKNSFKNSFLRTKEALVIHTRVTGK